jgi:pyrimidine operon attenuation protein / uracil phosphoribosyltransferase
MTRREILSREDINKALTRLAYEAVGSFPEPENLAIVGIHTRGVPLAKRIAAKLKERTGVEIPQGVLDITFYRDDLATRGELPEVKETRINFDITNRDILLIDDVIYTGRSTKAALETLMSFGRPRSIRLMVLVDRGSRDLPIQPDFTGYKVEAGAVDTVVVFLEESDNTQDSVIITSREPS